MGWRFGDYIRQESMRDRFVESSLLFQARRSFQGLFFTLLVIVSCSGCAKVAEPVPPLVRTPDAPHDIELIQEGGREVWLRFSIADGEVSRVLIYRQCGPPFSQPFPRSPHAEPAREDLLQLGSSVYLFRDPSPERDQICRYTLGSVSQTGHLSPLSESVETLFEVPARPPFRLRAQVSEDQIVVGWDPPEAGIDGSQPPVIEGYLVNSQHWVDGPEFVDSTFQFGRPVTYRVQTVTRRRNPLILSEFSHPLTLLPEDVFPPSAPKNVTAIRMGERVQLFWDPGEEADLEGYFVYRGVVPEQIEKSSPLITINRYTDEAPLAGSVHYYQVTAVDKRGNESSRSQPVSLQMNR